VKRRSTLFSKRCTATRKEREKNNFAGYSDDRFFSDV
jgi:hypothetical protein